MKSGAHTGLLRWALAGALGVLTGAAAENTPPAESPAPAEVGKPNPQPPANAAPPKPKAPVPKPRPRLSPEITAQLVAGLPVWAPPPPEKAPAPPAPTVPADPDVVPMKPVVVLGDRLPPRIDEKEWLTPKARADVLTKEYLSDFDRSFLNRFTLPLFGVSKEARAQMMYEEEKRLRDLKWMDDQIEQAKKLDPAAAKDLTKIRDDTFTRQPE